MRTPADRRNRATAAGSEGGKSRKASTSDLDVISVHSSVAESQDELGDASSDNGASPGSRLTLILVCSVRGMKVILS